MIPIMLILNPPTPQKNHHSAFKNIQTKNGEKEDPTAASGIQTDDCCFPHQRKSPSRVHSEEGTHPPNELLQLRHGARQYLARGVVVSISIRWDFL
jgi:hypothetical protein